MENSRDGGGWTRVFLQTGMDSYKMWSDAPQPYSITPLPGPLAFMNSTLAEARYMKMVDADGVPFFLVEFYEVGDYYREVIEGVGDQKVVARYPKGPYSELGWVEEYVGFAGTVFWGGSPNASTCCKCRSDGNALDRPFFLGGSQGNGECKGYDPLYQFPSSAGRGGSFNYTIWIREDADVDPLAPTATRTSTTTTRPDKLIPYSSMLFASQSSTAFSEGPASNALTANPQPRWPGTCTHTDEERQAWWKVRLDGEWEVSAVVLTNRADCCPARLQQIDIFVDDARCASNVSVGRGETKEFACFGLGQSIKIQALRPQILTLCGFASYGSRALATTSTTTISTTSSITRVTRTMTRTTISTTTISTVTLTISSITSTVSSSTTTGSSTGTTATMTSSKTATVTTLTSSSLTRTTITSTTTGRCQAGWLQLTDNDAVYAGFDTAQLFESLVLGSYPAPFANPSAGMQSLWSDLQLVPTGRFLTNPSSLPFKMPSGPSRLRNAMGDYGYLSTTVAGEVVCDHLPRGNTNEYWEVEEYDDNQLSNEESENPRQFRIRNERTGTYLVAVDTSVGLSDSYCSGNILNCLWTFGLHSSTGSFTLTSGAGAQLMGSLPGGSSISAAIASTSFNVPGTYWQFVERGADEQSCASISGLKELRLVPRSSLQVSLATTGAARTTVRLEDYAGIITVDGSRVSMSWSAGSKLVFSRQGTQRWLLAQDGLSDASFGGSWSGGQVSFQARICLMGGLSSVEVSTVRGECGNLSLDSSVTDDCTTSLWTWAGLNTCPVLVSDKVTCSQFCGKHSRACIKSWPSASTTCIRDFAVYSNPGTGAGCQQQWDNQICVCSLSMTTSTTTTLHLWYETDLSSSVALLVSKPPWNRGPASYQSSTSFGWVSGIIENNRAKVEAALRGALAASLQVQAADVSISAIAFAQANPPSSTTTWRTAGSQDCSSYSSESCCSKKDASGRDCVPSLPGVSFADGSKCLALCKVMGHCGTSQLWQVPQMGVCEGPSVNDVQSPGTRVGVLQLRVDFNVHVNATNKVSSTVERIKARIQALNSGSAGQGEEPGSPKRILSRAFGEHLQSQTWAGEDGTWFLDHMTERLLVQCRLQGGVGSSRAQVAVSSVLGALALGQAGVASIASMTTEWMDVLVTVPAGINAEDLARRFFASQLGWTLTLGEGHMASNISEARLWRFDGASGVLDRLGTVREHAIDESVAYFVFDAPLDKPNCSVQYDTAMQQNSLVMDPACANMVDGQRCNLSCASGYVQRCEGGATQCGIYECRSATLVTISHLKCEAPCQGLPRISDQLEGTTCRDGAAWTENATCEYACQEPSERLRGLDPALSIKIIRPDLCIAGTPCAQGVCYDFGWAAPVVTCSDRTFCPAGPGVVGHPIIPNGSADECVNRFVGGTCEFTCNFGYKVAPDSTAILTCLENGSWAQSTPCEIIRCTVAREDFTNRPAAFNRTYYSRSCLDMLPGQDCLVAEACNKPWRMECLGDNGDVVSPETCAQATCKFGGTVQVKRHVCRNPCIWDLESLPPSLTSLAREAKWKQITPPNASVVTAECDFMEHGESCTLKCEPLYKVRGAGNLTCSDGQVNTDPDSISTCFKPDCPRYPPEGLLPENAINDCGITAPHASFCNFTCAEGYTERGDIQCWMGFWRKVANDPPRCLPPCGMIPGITDLGKVSRFTGYLPGTGPSPTGPSDSVENRIVNPPNYSSAGPLTRSVATRVGRRLLFNEGATYDVSCQRPRLPVSSLTLERYECRQSEFVRLEPPPTAAGLQCRDVPCPQPPSLPSGGKWICNFNGKPISQSNGPFPMNTVCYFECPNRGTIASPPNFEFHCKYAYTSSGGEQRIAQSNAEPRFVPIDSVPQFVATILDNETGDRIIFSADPTCVRTTCDLPARLGGAPVILKGDSISGLGISLTVGLLRVECNGDRYGDQCEPVCDEDNGYFAEKNESAPDSVQSYQCNEFGLFVGSVLCNPTRCLGEPDWIWSNRSGTTVPGCGGSIHGAKCRIVCNLAGYDPLPGNPRPSFECNIGHWVLDNRSKPIPCLERACTEPPQLDNLDPESVITCSVPQPPGFICPARCLPGYVMQGSVFTCFEGEYRSTGLGCVLAGVPGITVKALRADISMVAAQDTSAAAVSNRSQAANIIASILVTNPDLAQENPAALGAEVATSLVFGNGADPSETVNSVMDALQNADQGVRASLTAAVSAAKTVTADAAVAGADISAMALIHGASPKEVIDTIVRAAVDSGVDAQHLVGMLSSALDAVSSRVQTSQKSVLALDEIYAGQGRRLGLEFGRRMTTNVTLQQVLGVAAVVGDSTGNSTVSELGGRSPDDTDITMQAVRSQQGAQLGNMSLLFADVVAAFSVSRLRGIQLAQMDLPRISMKLRNAVRSASDDAVPESTLARSQTIDQVARELVSLGLSDKAPDVLAAAAHAIALEAGLTIPEAQQVAAGVALHSQIVSCTGDELICQARLMVYVSEASRCAGELAKLHSGIHAREAAFAAVWAVRGAGLLSTAELAIAASSGAAASGLPLEQLHTLCEIAVKSVVGKNPKDYEVQTAIHLSSLSKTLAEKAVNIIEEASETGALPLGFKLAMDLETIATPLTILDVVNWALSAATSLPSPEIRAAGVAASIYLGIFAAPTEIARARSMGSTILQSERSPETLASAVRTGMGFSKDEVVCGAARVVSFEYSFDRQDGALAAALGFGNLSREDVVPIQELVRSPSFSLDPDPSFVKIGKHVSSKTPRSPTSISWRLALGFVAAMSLESPSANLAQPLAAALSSIGPGVSVGKDASALGPMALCVGASLQELTDALILTRHVGSSRNPVLMGAECLTQAALVMDEDAFGPIYERAALSSAILLAEARGQGASALHMTDFATHVPVDASTGRAAVRAQKAWLNAGNNPAYSALAEDVAASVLALHGNGSSIDSSRDRLMRKASATYYASLYEALGHALSLQDGSMAVASAVGAQSPALAVSVAGFLAATTQPRPEHWPASLESVAATATQAAIRELQRNCAMEKAGCQEAVSPCSPHPGLSTANDCPERMHSNETTCEVFCQAKNSILYPSRCLRAALDSNLSKRRILSDHRILSNLSKPSNPSTVAGFVNCETAVDRGNLGDVCLPAAPSGLTDAQSCAATFPGPSICVCTGPSLGVQLAAAWTQGAARIMSEAGAIRQLARRARKVLATAAATTAGLDAIAGDSNINISQVVEAAAVARRTATITPEQGIQVGYDLASAKNMSFSDRMMAGAQSGEKLGLKLTEALALIPNVLVFTNHTNKEVQETFAAVPSKLLARGEEWPAIVQAMQTTNLLEDATGRVVDRSAFLAEFETVPYLVLKSALDAVQPGATAQQAGAAVASASGFASTSSLQKKAMGLAHTAALQAGLGASTAAGAAAWAARSLGAELADVAQELVQLLLITGISPSTALGLVAQSFVVDEALSARLQAVTSEFMASSSLFYSPQTSWKPLDPRWTKPEVFKESEAVNRPVPYNGLDATFMKQHDDQIVFALAEVFGVQPEQVILRTITDLRASARRLSFAAARRSSASVMNGCRIDFLIIVNSTTDNENLILQKMQDFGDPKKSIYQEYVRAFSRELRALRDVVVPKGLYVAQVAATNVEKQDNFRMVASKWLVISNWTECPAQCGSGAVTRQIVCSTGNREACDKETVTGRPRTEQTCYEYASCPFDWKCALGGKLEEFEGGMTCDDQFLASVGLAAIPGLLFLFIISIIVCKLLRRRTGGALMFQTASGEQFPVNFSIQQRAMEDRDPFSSKGLGSSKTVVVWHLDDETQRSLNEITGRGGLTTDVKSHGNTAMVQKTTMTERRRSIMGKLANAAQEADVSHKEFITRREVEEQEEFERNNRAVELPPAKYAFEPGNQLEYFSSTHHRWLQCVVMQSYEVPNQDFHFLDIEVGHSKQPRHGVHLQSLRSRLGEGEPVSVYSSKLEGWLRGEIAGRQSAACTAIGYQVRVADRTLGEDGLLQNVPAVRLRRRFVEGAQVEAYLDTVRGWVPGTVMRTAEMSENLVFQAQADGSSAAAGEDETIAPSASTTKLAVYRKNSNNPGFQSLADDSVRWMPVTVRLEGMGVGEIGQVEVQAWQLRFQSSYLHFEGRLEL
eukprot:TRINITY_DN9276_c0_g1_i3.p1 TRINITY_DN9276_c0_g1~~TRINITY_DN9276_c0_g1_i3.p1  ORF type:complete len:4336 (-),score=586.71 TRINITY_DN9276_c0_g1_i3:128-12493(-)